MVLRILYFFSPLKTLKSSLLLLGCNFHINSIFFISQWTYENMQNVLKFPICCHHISLNYILHCTKHQTIWIFFLFLNPLSAKIGYYETFWLFFKTYCFLISNSFLLHTSFYEKWIIHISKKISK